MSIKTIISRAFLLITLLFSLQTFAGNNPGDFKVTANGLKYKFINQNKDGLKPVLGDFVTVVAYYQAPDTILIAERVLHPIFFLLWNQLIRVISLKDCS